MVTTTLTNKDVRQSSDAKTRPVDIVPLAFIRMLRVQATLRQSVATVTRLRAARSISIPRPGPARAGAQPPRRNVKSSTVSGSATRKRSKLPSR